MKKFFAALASGILIFGMNVSEVDAKDFSKVASTTSTQKKYTPPPARYSPPQVPDYGLPKPAYTPPPPPESKK